MTLEEADEPTHTPLYFGTDPEAAVCPRHGDMIRQHVPLVVRDDRVYAPSDGAALYACPECCIDLFAVAGERTIDPDSALGLLWRRYVDDDWETLEQLFVDLGGGRVETQGDRTVVRFDTDTEPDETVLPASVRSRDDRLGSDDPDERGPAP